MSKKRLRNKNIKTKKIRGGLDLINSLKSGLEKKGESLTNDLEKKGESFTKDLEKKAESLTNDVTSEMESKVENKALSMVPGASTALSVASTIQKIMVPPTPGDKFRQALVNLSTKTDFKNYFEDAINKIMVSEFYKILATLGEYSKKYSETVEKIVEITGASMFDDDLDFYSDLNIFPASPINKDIDSECTLSLESVIDKELKQLNVDQILDDANIEEFLDDAMIIGVPVIENIFELLGKTIEKYKKIRNKMNTLLEKTDDIEKHFEDFRKLSDEAVYLINAIFNNFDTSNMRGGSECLSEGKEPTMPSDKEDFQEQSLLYKPDKNTDCVDESSIKLDKLKKMYEEKQHRIEAKDDFYNTLLKMCITGRNNLSKLLKQKLSTILNRIIKRLYDIANTKNIINGDEIRDDEDFTDYKYLKEGEDKSVDFDLLEYPLFQETIANTTKQLICKIQKKSEIDTQRFKDIVKPAFIDKKEQLRDLVKIWSTDVSEKERLIKKLRGDVDDEITKYVTDLKEQIQIAVDTQKRLKAYIKSAKEKEKEIKEKEEQKKREKELQEKEEQEKADTDALKKATEDFKKTEEDIKRENEIANQNKKIQLKLEQDELNQKRKENERIFKEQLEKKADEIRKGVEARKKAFAVGGTTRKFSSPVSQKTRRRRQTSQ